jgi:mono/diheme cytochrome c family protein
MRRWLHRALWLLGILLAFAIAAVAAGLALGERNVNRRIDIRPYALAIPADSAATERGHYLFASRGCADCHGADGAGRVFAKDGEALVLAGPNISPGPGSVVAAYRSEDWERTLRHGVKPDGRPIRVMPSQDYNRLTDADLGAIVAFVKSLPPVDGGAATISFPLPVRVLYGLGLIPDTPERIDHDLPPAQPVAEGLTVEHGRYVAQMCIGCHGPKFEGGPIVGGPPGWPPAARLVRGQGNVMPRYADADAFVGMLRSGKRSDGSAIAVMPFEALSKLSDVDARALHRFLESLQ